MQSGYPEKTGGNSMQNIKAMNASDNQRLAYAVKTTRNNAIFMYTFALHFTYSIVSKIIFYAYHSDYKHPTRVGLYLGI